VAGASHYASSMGRKLVRMVSGVLGAAVAILAAVSVGACSDDDAQALRPVRVIAAALTPTAQDR